MRKVFAVITLMLVLVGMLSMTAFAATAHESWNDVVDDMEAILNKSYDIYVSGMRRPPRIRSMSPTTRTMKSWALRKR